MTMPLVGFGRIIKITSVSKLEKKEKKFEAANKGTQIVWTKYSVERFT